ncbi:MAG: leucine-rich repeat domain-containing protein [Clostridia bacterium]|nr:leucine-rich repeat domain-containing protein [Clostridia bacterium]
MVKRKVSSNLGTIALILTFLAVIYLSFESLGPIITYIIQQEMDKSTSEVDTANAQEQLISYEEKQRLMKEFPNYKYTGKVYYTVYGKKVLEDDTYLDLSDVQIDDNIIENLSLLSNIKEVNLYNQALSNNKKIELQEMFPNITFRWTVDIMDKNVDYSIESMDLSNRTIQDIEALKQSLKLLPNLKKLDMSNTNLTNEELGGLREQFQNIKIDWIVHLGKWSLRTDSVAFSVLIVDYNYKRMTSEDIQVLKYCTDLQALDLGHQAIEDISVIGEYLPNLRVLILADNKIKDISPLANLKHLHYLELFMNDITDATALQSCRELVDLNICFNYHFSDIQPILDLPLLERLWLISDNISAESYRIIREKYPNVQLVTTGTGSTNSGWRTHERYYSMIDMYRNNYISDEFLKYDNK